MLKQHCVTFHPSITLILRNIKGFFKSIYKSWCITMLYLSLDGSCYPEHHYMRPAQTAASSNVSSNASAHLKLALANKTGQ